MAPGDTPLAAGRKSPPATPDMKQQLKAGLRKVLRPFFSGDLFAHYPTELLKSHTDEKAAQLLLQQNYRTLLRSPERPLPDFKEVGFRKYSQFEEDGILLYLFSLIPPISRTCLEICAGSGLECNTANLIINHGWWGCLFDGSAENVAKGQAFYAAHADTFVHPPTFRCAWITTENINALVREAGFTGKIDLLSLDIDGNDYWLWQALDVVEPTVVVCEINNTVPPELALTIPYDPEFGAGGPNDDFRGASLRAMMKLGRAKGYRLVGTHRYGFNAFFVREGVLEDALPEVTPEQCAGDPYTRSARETRWPKVKDRGWVEV